MVSVHDMNYDDALQTMPVTISTVWLKDRFLMKNLACSVGGIVWIEILLITCVPVFNNNKTLNITPINELLLCLLLVSMVFTEVTSAM